MYFCNYRLFVVGDFSIEIGLHCDSDVLQVDETEILWEPVAKFIPFFWLGFANDPEDLVGSLLLV